MTDSLKCFTFLAENVPSWIMALDNLEQKVKARQSEVARLPANESNMRRTGSNESIRGLERGDGARRLESRSAPQSRGRPNPPSPRTQRTLSLLSGGGGSPRSRGRNAVIIYYDSEIQSGFEQIVRFIALGRAQIRQARMMGRMEAFGSRRGLSDRLGNQNETPDELVSADSQLERAQSLCERGAHVFLRDGECKAETSAAIDCFEQVVLISQREIPRLLALKEQKELERRQRSRGEQRMGGNPADMSQNGGIILAADNDLDYDDEDEYGDEDDYDPSAYVFSRTRFTTRT